MNKKAKAGEIWLVAIPTLYVKGPNDYDTGFQIRPFLIVDEGKGVLVIENPDYLALKITTKSNKLKTVKEIYNWQQLGLKEKSYIRIEIPQRIEENQLIGKIAELPRKQFLSYYKSMFEIFNSNALKEIMKTDEEIREYCNN